MKKRIVCFGEVLLRLGAPGRELLLQSPRFEVCVGGAEANVGVALAHFGHPVGMAGAVADNALGHAALGELRRHGVETRHLHAVPGRMGLYFHTRGAGHRPSGVLYDRAGSAFAAAQGGAHDWPQVLRGAVCLHVSGVTPALGPGLADAALQAMRAARAAGVLVSFDGNFRPTLWQASEGDPGGILRDLIAQADLLFANERDIEVVLHARFGHATPQARFRAASEAAFRAFPALQRMTATVREQVSVDHHRLGALMAPRGGALLECAPLEVGGIVDRIGGGDAFAAGVLHGVLAGMGDAGALAFGHASGCLKHYQPGDFSTLGVDEVLALVYGERLDVRR